MDTQTFAVRAELIWDGGLPARERMLLIDGDRVEGVVGESEIPSDVPIEDWGAVALMPGTVNAHGHAFQSLLKGFADDRPFESWRDDVLYPFSERIDQQDIYAGALFAFAEALLAGTTTTTDFFYLNDEGNDNARLVIEAAHALGIRLVLARTFYDVDAPTAAPARYREETADSARRCRELAAGHASDPLVSVQPAPHSLHAAAPATIAAALEVAHELDVACHLHLAEARYERDQVAERYGATPVRLLQREKLLDKRLVTTHAVWVDEEEIGMLADAGVGVVHCAGANAFLGDGIAPIPEMIERGVRVALGPDGGCANNRQSVFDEMRTAGLVAKARLTDGGALDAATAFRLGTEAGGDLLGLPVGSFKPGAFADAVALDLDDLSLHPLSTIERQVVNALQPTAITKVMVGGEVVVEDGALTRFDLAEIRARVAETTAGWERP